MTIMMRRFTIICLSAALFAVGLLALVESHERRPHIGSLELSAPCPQPEGLQCRTRL